MHRIFLTTILLALICFFQQPGKAQALRNKRKIPAASHGGAEVSQWWLGVKGGTNFTTAVPSTSYSVFSYIDQPSGTANHKQYKNFSKPGLQFGFVVSFEFQRSLSANFAPAYTSLSYEYNNGFNWYAQENTDQSVSLDYNFQDRLQYIDLPVYFKYELLKGKFKPYIQAGGYYDHLVNAIQNTKTSNIDRASGAESELYVSEFSSGLTDHFIKSSLGILGGIGFTYNLGNARFGLEANYRYGMNNITQVKNRFVDSQQVTGTYDVQDDLSLNNLGISIMCIIPLKFITSKDYVPL